MKPKKPGPIKRSSLEHPKGMVRAWNGDLRPQRNPDRWNGSSDYEDVGFHSRGVTSSSGNHQSPKTEYINGIPTKVSPTDTEVTGRTIKPAPKSLAVGGHMQGRHEPTNNLPEHYSPWSFRQPGQPEVADLKLRSEGTDGHAR